MADQDGDIQRFLLLTLQETADKEHISVFFPALEAIVTKNKERGRFNWYLDQNPKHTVQTYVEKVVHQYMAQHDYIEALQIHKSIPAWTALQEKSRILAYKYLYRWGFSGEESTLVADDVAQEACMEILFAHYPYDSNFDAWITVLVHNVCRKHAQRMRAEGKMQADLSHANLEIKALSSQAHELELKLSAAKEDVMGAIQQLSQIQQDVILSHYMMGKSLAGIADESGVPANVIHKRHHDALKRLRKILESSEH